MGRGRFPPQVTGGAQLEGQHRVVILLRRVQLRGGRSRLLVVAVRPSAAGGARRDRDLLFARVARATGRHEPGLVLRNIQEIDFRRDGEQVLARVHQTQGHVVDALLDVREGRLC